MGTNLEREKGAIGRTDDGTLGGERERRDWEFRGMLCGLGWFEREGLVWSWICVFKGREELDGGDWRVGWWAIIYMERKILEFLVVFLGLL